MAEYICPHCKNPINDDDALLCLYCGNSLQRKTGFISSIPHKWFIAIVIIVLLSFIALVI